MREFWTRRFQKRLVARPILRPPHASRTLEYGLRRYRIGNDRRIERRCFAAGRDRTAGDYPLRRVAILEVHVVESAGKRIESQRRISGGETGLAAVAVDDLRPR